MPQENWFTTPVPQLSCRVSATGGFCWCASFVWPPEVHFGNCPPAPLEKGERALHAAKRELEEETGYGSSSWSKLTEYYPSPGFLDEKMTLFLARDIRPGTPHQETDERIQVRSFSMRELLSLMRAGKIRDGKTLLGLLYFRWLGS